jgi:mevalonate kinase
MPAFTATAPGKIILFGEHAVVYGQPAIAVPVTQVQARATFIANPRGAPGEVMIQAPEIGLQAVLDELGEDDPLRAAVRGVMGALKVPRIPACTLIVTATIPVASGLGSGAAVSVAIIRALAGFLGQPLDDGTVSTLAFEVEKIHHGTPSGIDNSVVTYRVPVFFQKGLPLQTFSIGEAFTLVIGDTGVRSPTRETVAAVRGRWLADPTGYERLFAAIGSITRTARDAIQGGYATRLGPLMDENHALLQMMGVSSEELDHLVSCAKSAGAWGAKLSGGGCGGNMVALCDPVEAEAVQSALEKAGAVRTILTRVGMNLDPTRVDRSMGHTES